MDLPGGGYRHCHNCGIELTDSVESCPSCEFNPKDDGLRLAGYVLLLVPILWIIGIGFLAFDATIASTLLVLGMGACFLSGLVYIVAMAARPYRLGWLISRIRF